MARVRPEGQAGRPAVEQVSVSGTSQQPEAEVDMMQRPPKRQRKEHSQLGQTADGRKRRRGVELGQQSMLQWLAPRRMGKGQEGRGGEHGLPAAKHGRAEQGPGT